VLGDDEMRCPVSGHQVRGVADVGVGANRQRRLAGGVACGDLVELASRVAPDHVVTGDDPPTRIRVFLGDDDGVNPVGGEDAGDGCAASPRVGR